MKKEFVKAITNFLILSILVIGVGVFLIFREDLIGPAYILLGLIGIGLLKLYKIKFKEIYPDFIFGLIDNGVLVFTAVLGGIYAGVAGAVLGGLQGIQLLMGWEDYLKEKLQRGFEKKILLINEALYLQCLEK